MTVTTRRLLMSSCLCGMKKKNVMEVAHTFSEVVERNNSIRKDIMARLLDNFGEMKSGKVLRGALWITGEYSLDMESK